MTKADCAATGDPDPKLIANPLLIRKDPAVREARRILAKVIGAPASLVFPMITYYSHETLCKVNDQLNVLHLEALKAALHIVEDRMHSRTQISKIVPSKLKRRMEMESQILAPIVADFNKPHWRYDFLDSDIVED